MSEENGANRSVADRVYEELKAMTISYSIKPGERMNEGDLSRQLGVSRTPLREALNRLHTEGFLRFEPGRGFFCRKLDVQELFDLYELRKLLEVASIRLAVTRASDAEIAELLAFLDAASPDFAKLDKASLLEFDETFHERLMSLSKNAESLRVLRNVNARIRFVRGVDMDRVRGNIQPDHSDIVLALQQRDEALCVECLEKHIDRRFDQITAAIKEGIAQIYMRTD